MRGETRNQVRQAAWHLLKQWHRYHRTIPHYTVHIEAPRNLLTAADVWPADRDVIQKQAAQVKQLLDEDQDHEDYDRWEEWRGLGQWVHDKLWGNGPGLRASDLTLLYASGALVIHDVPGPHFSGERLKLKLRNAPPSRWSSFIQSYSGLMRVECNDTLLGALRALGWWHDED